VHEVPFGVRSCSALRLYSGQACSGGTTLNGLPRFQILNAHDTTCAGEFLLILIPTSFSFEPIHLSALPLKLAVLLLNLVLLLGLPILLTLELIPD